MKYQSILPVPVALKILQRGRDANLCIAFGIGAASVDAGAFHHTTCISFSQLVKVFRRHRTVGWDLPQWRTNKIYLPSREEGERMGTARSAACRRAEQAKRSEYSSRRHGWVVRAACCM